METTDESRPVPMERVFKDKSLLEILEKHGIDPKEFQDLTDVVEYDLPTKEGEPPKRLLFVFSGNEYVCYYIVGNKRWGKSTWLEWAGEKYKKNDYFTMDWFDAGDFEACYWGIRTCKQCLRPIRFDEKVCPDCDLSPKPAYKVLMVVPEYAQVSIADPNFKLYPVEFDDDECLPEIAKIASKEDRVVSVAVGVFQEDHIYKMLTEWMYQWLQVNRDMMRTDTCVLLREAADVAFSRKKTSTSKYQSMLGKATINLVRKAGHVRTVLFFDAQRFMELDIGVRGNLPYTIVKRHSKDNMSTVVHGLNERIKEQREMWYYDYNLDKDVINHKRPEVTYLHKDEFYCMFDDGEYRIGYNGFPTFHHKGTKDYFDLLTDMDFDQDLFSLNQMSRVQTIREVPKAALLGLAFNLHDKYNLKPSEIAKEFGRQETTIRGWIKQFKGRP